ncbi:flap endonuclease GEN homolog 1-like [Asterias rubens]|uniref:flap endonuclease GEN homolog 1-like n=1 Tax=Asterias rubens TaxID=7604 RepID=UPI001455AFA6|nr:flap endonuclease GEN homolog 1-like [Asterias rubens]
MGVNCLWGIIAPVKTHKSLKLLKGQTLAVDLAIWICESASVLQGVVVKPHLRNLFFRVTNLTQMGINLIFVLDGEPPELKWEEMARRNEVRFGEGGETKRGRGGRWGHHRRGRAGRGRGGATEQGGTVQVKKKKSGRSRFKFVLNECKEMLDHLGIPCLQARGEAEAMCALLNKQGIADACLTEDGDVFLYGARTVYKNFSLQTNDPQIECYSTDDIETKLGLDNDKLIALSLLLGCDYIPDGVPGIGKYQAIRLLNNIESGVNVLERFQDWSVGRIPRDCILQEVPTKVSHCTRCTHAGPQKDHRVYGCAMCNSDIACHPKSSSTPKCTCSWHVITKEAGKSSLERDLMKKACADANFPSKPIIEEYRSVKDRCPAKRLKWRRPKLLYTEKFIAAKMEWPVEYTIEKVLPLVTLWDLRAIASGHPADPALHLTPAAVVKRRTRQGVACVEIHWHKQAGLPSMEQEYLTTIEKEELFTKAFPDIMRAFEEEKLAAKPNKKGKRNNAQPSQCLVSGSGDRSESPSANVDEIDALSSAVSDLSLVQRSTSPDDTEARLSSRIEESSCLKSFAPIPEVLEEGEKSDELNPLKCNDDAKRSKSMSDVTFTSALSVRVALRLKKASEEMQKKTDSNLFFDEEDDFPQTTKDSPNSSLCEVFMDDDPLTDQKKDHHNSVNSSKPEETKSTYQTESLKKVEGKPHKKKRHQKKLRSASSSAALPSSAAEGRRKILALSERKRLKTLLASLDDSTFSVDEECPQDMRRPLSSLQGSVANFNLGFEMTKMLSEDDSMLLDLNEMDVSNRSEVKATTRDSNTEANVDSSGDDGFSNFVHVDRSSPDLQIYESSDSLSGESLGKPYSACDSNDDPNFSLKFEFTKMLDENDSLLPSEEADLSVNRTETRLTADDESKSCESLVEETDLSVDGRTDTRLTADDECMSGDKSEPLQRFTSTGQGFTDDEVNTKTENKDPWEAKSKEESFSDQKSSCCLIVQKHPTDTRDDYEDLTRSVASSLDGPMDVIRGDGLQVVEAEGYTNKESSLLIPKDCTNQDNVYNSPGDISRQTSSEYLYQTFAPPPPDIDTPTLCDESPIGSFSQSNGSVYREPPIREAVLPSLSNTASQLKTNLTANHLSATPRSSQSQTLSHDYENSPVSLMDRLRIKHGGRDNKGVLSAVTSMKSGVDIGNKLRGDRKVLRELFDNN